MIYRLLIMLMICVLLGAVPVVSQDEHEGHDHDEVVAGVEDLDPEEQPEHEETIVQLSQEGQKLAGISLSRAKAGRIALRNELPGEIGFNEDRLVHIAPRFAGIALEARFRVGSYVKAGEVVAVIESNESMNSYSIKAPISGWIIERHVTPGEYVSGESSIYVLADLSTVWVSLAVYPKDVKLVRAGQAVLITAVGSTEQVAGEIDFVTPVLDAVTRSSTARVVLSNPDNVWRPGTFVHAQVVTGAGTPGLVVERDAVQYVGGVSVVFVVEGPGEFAAIEVIVGDSDDKHVRILSGLSEGSEYVASGAFELKALIVTSSLGGHAGHGH
ncbi:MAG: efflux RND transporter periplasmic adaptor subunit [candidate division Zixibacteria bacterium]